MTEFENIFAPYHFSETRCIVFPLEIKKKGLLKIEFKLPIYVSLLKDIYISSSATGKNPVSGYITLNFNGHDINCMQYAVIKSVAVDDYSKGFPVNELIQPNSFMQGFYYDAGSTKKYPYTIKIYLHYKNSYCENHSIKTSGS